MKNLEEEKLHAKSAGSWSASMKPYLKMGGNLNKIDEIFLIVPPNNKIKVDIANIN